jgi:DNA (cytosine-5)-methyltransferase 1
VTLNDTGSTAFEPDNNDVPATEPAGNHTEATQRADRLLKARERIATLRTNMAKIAFEIADKLEAIRDDLQPKYLKAFASGECGIARSDVKTYLSMSKMLGSKKDRLQKSGVAFSVLKALAAADSDVRDEAVSALEAMTPIDLGDIRAIRRRRRERAETSAEASARRRNQTLRHAMRNRATASFETFIPEFTPFMDLLSAFYFSGPLGETEFHRQSAAIRQLAGDCLQRFEALFDTNSLPNDWEYGLYEDTSEQVWMARAHEALKMLAKGEFNLFDEETGNPFDKENVVDEDYFDAIGWLFGRRDDWIGRSKDLKSPKHAVSAPVVAPPHPLVSLEICAGAGGEALGLHAAGFRAKAIYERDPHAVRTLRHHTLSIIDRVNEADIREVDFTGMRGKIDLVAGGVPCQGHSVAGHRLGRHDERDLFLEAVRIVEEVRPRAFFFENVNGFNQRSNTDYRAELHQMFNALGYQNKVFALRGADYGLAQGRPRIAFVGFRDGEMSRFRMPPVFPQWNPTVASVIGDLVGANNWPGFDAWLKKADRIGPTIIGGSEKSGKLSFSAYFGRERWAELGIDMKKLTDHAPDERHGTDDLFQLTLAMGARLQGFPDGYEFQGPAMERKRQIGNALPPIMAKVIGLAIYSALEGVEFDYETALKVPVDVPRRPATKPLRINGKLNLNGESRPGEEDELRFFGEWEEYLAA